MKRLHANSRSFDMCWRVWGREDFFPKPKARAETASQRVTPAPGLSPKCFMEPMGTFAEAGVQL